MNSFLPPKKIEYFVVVVYSIVYILLKQNCTNCIYLHTNLSKWITLSVFKKLHC